MRILVRIESPYRVFRTRTQAEIYRAGYDGASLADPKIVSGIRTPVRLAAFLAAKARPNASGGEFLYFGRDATVTIPFRAANTQYHSVYFKRFRFGYEPEVCAALQAYLNAPSPRGNPSFWDVGANWGHFVGFAGSLPEFYGPIVAVEPNPTVVRDLKLFLREAGLTDRVRVVPIAFGESEAEGTLVLPDAFHSGIAEVHPTETQNRLSTKRGLSVTVGAADFQVLPTPTIVKIDVEGAEASVLRGMRATLEEARCPVVFESFFGSDRRSSVEPYLVLAELGYRFFQLCYEVVDRGENEGRPYTDVALSPLEHDADTRFELRPKLNCVAVHGSDVPAFFDRLKALPSPPTKSPVART